MKRQIFVVVMILAIFMLINTTPLFSNNGNSITNEYQKSEVLSKQVISNTIQHLGDNGFHVDSDDPTPPPPFPPPKPTPPK